MGRAGQHLLWFGFMNGVMYGADSDGDVQMVREGQAIMAGELARIEWETEREQRRQIMFHWV